MPPEQRVTLATIAKRSGVNKSTVSRALQGKLVAADTRRRILRIARELGYEPAEQHAARRLASQKSGATVINHVLALFFPPILFREPYYLPLLRGAMEYCQAKEFSLLIFYDSMFREGDLPPVFVRGDVDGIVVYAHPANFRPSLERLRGAAGFGDRPVVSLLSPMDDCSCVSVDEEEGGYLAAKHLLDLGHRRILYFREHHTNSPLRYRFLGYERACREAGVDSAQTLVEGAWSAGSREDTTRLVEAVFRQHPDLTAVLAQNDTCAVWTHDILTGLGLIVPRDISLVGYDDSEPVLDGRGHNMLTTINVPLFELGREAASLVIQQAETGAAAVRKVSLPVHLVDRRSTAPPGARSRRTGARNCNRLQ